MTEKQIEIRKKAIFIGGEVPSSKNSKVIGYYFLPAGSSSNILARVRATLRPVRLNLNSSKVTKRYQKSAAMEYSLKKSEFKNLIKNLEPPFRVVFSFVRKTKRKFDYINAAQIVQDMMVDHGWIEDDNCEYLIPYFEKWEHNKNHPGVYISVF